MTTDSDTSIRSKTNAYRRVNEGFYQNFADGLKFFVKIGQQ
jgi:hypothetical protein